MAEHLQRHPHFGNTLADYFMEHHRNPLSFHGPIVHVKATIKLVEEDEAFCAIRYGDKLDLKNLFQT
nr:hypothetical protein [Bacillus sp. AFS018417]